MRSDADIARMLLEHAARWQATLRTDTSVDMTLFRSGASRGPISGVVLAVAAFGVIAAAVALYSVGHSPTVTGPGASSTSTHVNATVSPSMAVRIGLQDSVVGVGDVVVATGTLVATGSTEGFLCTAVAWAGERPLCARSTGVPLHLHDDALAGQYVKVRGVWDGTSIGTSEITAIEASPAEPLRLVNCRTPAGGWPGKPTGDDGESNVRTLETEVLRHPALYVGMWSGVASSPDVPDTVPVLVVGTVGSVDAAAEHLAKAYTFNLCVVPVEYSADDLNRVVSSLSSFDFAWRLQVDPSVGRVAVMTNTLSQSMADALAGFEDFVEVRPLVTKAD